MSQNKYLYGFLCVLLFVQTGCVTQKRCARRFPPTVVKDSTYIYVHDSVLIRGGERVDTLIDLRTIRDTSFITKDRVQVKWHRVSDTLYRVQVICPEDTLRNRTTVSTTKTELMHTQQSNQMGFWPAFGLGALALLLIYIGIRLLLRR